MRSQRRFSIPAVVAGVAAAMTVASVGNVRAADKISITETGSSLCYPLFNLWIPVYTAAHPDVQITAQATGSGTGIALSCNGTAQIGASDAFMSDALLKQHPDMLNIPLCISAQQVNYNVPGLNDKHLKLSGPVLAAIYSGTITMWDDPEIAKMNPGVKLPHETIIPIHRTDGSGDTFIFTDFLSKSTPSWASGPGTGVTVSWPAVQGGIGGVGNQGILDALTRNTYSISYLGVSWLDRATESGMGEAMLKNRAGNYVLPTADAISAAADAMFKQTPKDERISLIFAPGEKSYPIINYEYMLVKRKQPSKRMADAIKDLLTWGLSPDGGGSTTYLDKVHFKPLPESIRKLSEKQISMIHG